MGTLVIVATGIGTEQLSHPQKEKHSCWSSGMQQPFYRFRHFAGNHLLYRPENTTETGTYKLVTLKGEKSYLQLPDGTKVWLNSCTTIQYAEDYGRSNRNIHLSGEAYFEVARNEKKPFIVKANGIDVKALGTAFNISAYPEDTQLITTLFSGKVAVQPTLTKQQIMLAPNQVAIYYKSRNKIEVTPYDKNYLRSGEAVISLSR